MEAAGEGDLEFIQRRSQLFSFSFFFSTMHDTHARTHTQTHKDPLLLPLPPLLLPLLLPPPPPPLVRPGSGLPVGYQRRPWAQAAFRSARHQETRAYEATTDRFHRFPLDVVISTHGRAVTFPQSVASNLLPPLATTTTTTTTTPFFLLVSGKGSVPPVAND